MQSALVERICVSMAWKAQVVISLLGVQHKCGVVTAKIQTLNKENHGYCASLIKLNFMKCLKQN